jgi:uncharacterized protein YjdB
MRKFLITPLLALVVGFIACETSTSPDIASIGVTTGNAIGFAITPSRVRLLVGQTVQLSTNATKRLIRDNDVAWGSTDPAIAFVTPTGQVTGGQIGTATVFAQLLTDTMQVATATIQVVPR